MDTTTSDLDALRADIARALPWVRIAVRARAGSPLRLEAYNGSLFRSALGRHLLNRMCRALDRSACAGCDLAGACPFPPLLETRGWPTPGDHNLPPPGLVPEPPVGLAADVAVGTALRFGVVLIGRRADAITQTAVQRALWSFEAAEGLGDDRGRLIIDEMMTEASGAAAPLSPDVRRVRCRLTTPLRFKSSGAVQTTLETAAFWTSARQRLLQLARSHGAESLRLPPIEALGAMPTVTSVALERVRYQRFSRRQQAWMPLDGLEGSFALEGPLGRWAPILDGVVAMHLGSKTLFGFGGLEVRPEG